MKRDSRLNIGILCLFWKKTRNRAAIIRIVEKLAKIYGKAVEIYR